MKHSYLSPCILTFALIFAVACSKSNNNNNNGPATSGVAKYPATITKTDAAGRLVTTYEYNDKKQLIGYRREDGVIREFGAAQIKETVLSLTFTAINTWDFKDMSGSNIWEGGSVGTMEWESLYIYPNGNTQKVKRGTCTFTTTADGLIASTVTTNPLSGPSATNYLTYDGNKNLKQIEFFQSNDPVHPFNRLKVMGVDDKPSPFNAVRGYQWLSYPQAYAFDYSLAFLKNNATQIVIEGWDQATGTYKVRERNDFTYSYDADGYPVSITVSTTYLGPTTTGSSATYAIVYK